ncbi:MAG: RDD family protein [Desulfobacteraceae bacterium]
MQTIDTATNHETPEGIVLRLKTAGPVSRAYAWLIDCMIRAGVYLVLVSVLSAFSRAGTAGILICLFLLEWFYPVVFEVYSGATPGKRSLGLRVVHDNGTPVDVSSSLLRNLLRAADFFPLFYAAGLISMMFNKNFKRLGDMAAGTLVVYEEKQTRPAKTENTAVKQPPLELRVHEKQTILDFAERSRTLSKSRCIELVEILAALTGKKGEKAVKEVEAYAGWISRGK